MRTKTVTVNEKSIVIKEQRLKELQKEVLPKFMSIFKGEALGPDPDVDTLVTGILSKVTEIIPELTLEDLENSYPSELEALVEAWISVNFTGFKKILSLLPSLTRGSTSN